jgi:hypothetical protein
MNTKTAYQIEREMDFRLRQIQEATSKAEKDEARAKLYEAIREYPNR